MNHNVSPFEAVAFDNLKSLDHTRDAVRTFSRSNMEWCSALRHLMSCF